MIAQVCINYQDANVDKIFDYLVPANLESSIEVGKRVYVSFGVSDRIVEGLVVGLKQSTEVQENKLKSILAVIDKFSVVSKEQIELAFLMKSYYALNLGEALSLIIPPFVSNKQIYNICAKKYTEEVDLEDGLKSLYEQILKRPVSINSKIVKQNKEKIVKLFLNGLLEFDLKNFNVQNTAKKCVPTAQSCYELTEEQQKAVKTIISAFDEGRYKNILLFGVTGSGKTEVYIRAIQYVLEQGKSVIFMVPEISLTPQMIENVQNRIMNKVLVYHSKMKNTDRLNSWLAAKNSSAVVVIGPRSAVFAPVNNLGLIIVDEEHEPSYKSEKSPRINAVEVAQMRAKINNVPVILGSATPSIEHYYYANKGKYTLCTLKTRINKSLPEVLVVDMKREISEGNKSVFSRALLNEIESSLKKGEQVLLFLNRRGYSPIVICRECGYVFMCKNCSISLTYHKEGYLKCHYCGYKEEYKGVCVKCKSKYVRQYGSGTQKIEEEIKEYFKDARVLRIDTDTTSKKDSAHQLLKRFKEKEADILVGTQMIAKGLHFPDLTLVGVIDADILLNMPDFRSRERTFQLLTQVAGRSGREKPGKVIIQTFNPEDYSIVFASKHDYESFYAQEMKLRKIMEYPPYSYVVNFIVVAKEQNTAKRGIEHVYAIVKEYEDGKEIKVYGPNENPIFKIENQYRYHVLVKFKSAGRMISIANLIKERYNYSNASLVIDVNPLDTL